ncbi:MAG: hypothetical protein ACJARI_004108, partial [Bacteroidia bacterium]
TNIVSVNIPKSGIASDSFVKFIGRAILSLFVSYSTGDSAVKTHL